jgi:serine phosphatase RsbU (regulator of sigma subunit)
MRRPISLATRTFLLTFLAMCVVLVAGFFALNAALKARIKEGLKENLRLTEQQLDQQEVEYNRRATELIATLSENAGLKAAIGLSREQSKSALRAQVRETIEDQLRDLSRGLDFDLFMVIDTEGHLIATVGAPVDEEQARQVSSGGSNGPWLIRAGPDLFKVTSVPINLGVENLGRLAVGKRFDISSPGAYGYAVLTDRKGIVASTLPAAVNAEVEHQLSERCGQQKNGCEISAGGQNYLALGMARDWVTPDYHLLRLASIDEAMRGFTQGLRRVFIMTGLGGVLMAALFSLFASRSISKPLANLASDLESSGETGALWNEFRMDSSTREVNLLAGALNRAASARRQVEGALRSAHEQEFHLQIAHEVQQRLNTTVASLPGFDIAGTVCSATLTGGDYFDFIVQPDGCLCVAIGDVSGHGFGAALVMAETRAYVRSYAMLESDMGATLSRLNDALVTDLADGQYVTLLLARLDPRNRLVEYASAGHIPCYLLRPSGEIGHLMESTGPPLGLFANSQFCSSPAIALDYGETLVFLTDGVTEAGNNDEAPFGADRALEFIKSHLQNSAAELVRGIHETVLAFTGGRPPSDDITSIICKVSLAATEASA